MIDSKEVLKELVKEEIGVESDECAIYKAEHSNCNGCKYELGCGKYVALLMVSLQSSLYKPKDFMDSITTGKSVAKLMAQIIKAKTNDELKTLI